MNKKISDTSDISSMTQKIKSALIELTELPSKFLPYGGGSKIFYRPYTYRELDNYNDSTIGVAESLKFILEGVHTENMDKSNVTLGDFLYIGLLRKVSSLGTAEFQVTSSHNGKPISKVLTYEDIVFDDLEMEKLPVVLSLEQELHFRPITIGQYLSLVDKELETDERALLAIQCVNLKFEEAYSIINEALGKEIVYLKEIDKLLYHSVLPISVNFTLNGKEVHKNIEIDDPHVLVFPFSRSEELERTPIRFGV